MINQILASDTQTIAYVGQPATLLSWSDRRPATVVEIINGDTIVVQQDDFDVIDFMANTYTYKRNPEGVKYTFKRDKNGKLVEMYLNPRTKRWIKAGTIHLALGRREKYHDHAF